MLRTDQILFWGVISFISGVALGSFFIIQLEYCLILVAACVAVLSVFQKKNVLIAETFLCLGIIGVLHSAQATNRFRIDALETGKFSGTVRIVVDPEEGNFFQKIILHPETCESAYCPKSDILWQAPRVFTGEAGRRIVFSCTLELPKNFSQDFDYRMFLAKGGIGYFCEKAEKVEIVSEIDIEGYVRTWLYRSKHLFESALSRSITDPEAGLAKGLLLGGSGYLPENLKDTFARIGLSHIVAVSGYNITLIAQGLLFIGITIIGLWRRHAFWFATFGIALFVLMIGVPSSAVRAAGMAGVAFAAMQFGRLARPMNALCLTAALILVFEPLLLRFDTGFQLSFLATLAIVEASTLEQYFSPYEFFGKSFFELIWFSLMAELFVLPVILYQFHTFSPIMLLSNVIILPIVPYAMLLSFFSAFLFLVFPGLHIIFSWSAYGFLSYMTRCAEFLGTVSWSSVAVFGFSLWMVIVWYGALFFAIVKLKSYGKEGYYLRGFSFSHDRGSGGFVLHRMENMVVDRTKKSRNEDHIS